MLILRQMRRDAAAVAVFGFVAAGLGTWIWAPWGSAIVPTIPTGASFSVTVARSQDERYVRAIAARVAAAGLPAFTRRLQNGGQVVVGPYISIEEAEGAQRALTRRGFAARMLVDESVRRVAGHDGVPQVSSGPTVVLVAAAGRLSVVIELPAEPRSVLTRRVTDASLEIDAGPVTAPVARQRWQAPAGVTLIEQVSIEDVAAPVHRSLRTRLAISPSALSNVRVVGRRIYIDLWSRESLAPAAQRLAALQAGSPPRTLARRGANGPPSDVTPTPVGRAFTARQAAPTTDAPPDYRETIGPAVSRLEQMQPFVLSAAGSPAPDVLAALARTLGGLEESIRAMTVPREWTDTHGLVVTAIRLAIKAVDPGFPGDRTAQAHEAFALLDAAKDALQPLVVATNDQLPTTN